MKQERIYKTIEVKTKSGRVYRRTPYKPIPKFRGQRYTLLKGPGKGWATTRLTLTRAQYEQAQAAAPDVARAVGYPALSVGDTIAIASAVSVSALDGRMFTPAASEIWPNASKRPLGRRPKFRNDVAIVVLILSPGLAGDLSSQYDRYCELADVAELPRTGPVWAAFLHGVQVIREALGSA